MLISIENQTGFPLPLEQLEAIAKEYTDREIELIICDNATIRQANASYRSKDYPTDVLSFPLEGSFDTLPLGSIMISSDFAREKAALLGHTVEEESILLFIHGLLHLLGYDHETDNGEMRAEEAKQIRKLGLPESLIVRTEK